MIGYVVLDVTFVQMSVTEGFQGKKEITLVISWVIYSIVCYLQ